MEQPVQSSPGVFQTKWNVVRTRLMTVAEPVKAPARTLIQSVLPIVTQQEQAASIDPFSSHTYSYCRCTPPRVRHSQGMCVDLEECGITIAPTICNKTNEHWNSCGICEQTCINQNVMCLTACLPERAGCQ